MAPSTESTFQRIVVLIDDVDLPNRIVHARDKHNALIQIAFRSSPGAVLRIPAHAEKWIAERIGTTGQWWLGERLDSVAEHADVVETMGQGDARVSADNLFLNIESASINAHPFGPTTYDVFSTSGTATVFALSATPVHQRTVQAFINGLLIDPRSFTLASASLTFLSAPAVGTLVVYYQAITNLTEDAVTVISRAFVSGSDIYT